MLEKKTVQSTRVKYEITHVAWLSPTERCPLLRSGIGGRYPSRSAARARAAANPLHVAGACTGYRSTGQTDRQTDRRTDTVPLIIRRSPPEAPLKPRQHGALQILYCTVWTASINSAARRKRGFCVLFFARGRTTPRDGLLHLTVESYWPYGHYLPTVIVIVILIIIGIPSPTHSFTLGLNPSFSAKSSLPQPFLFLIQVSLYGFPRLFTVTSEHIRLFTF